MQLKLSFQEKGRRKGLGNKMASRESHIIIMGVYLCHFLGNCICKIKGNWQSKKVGGYGYINMLLYYVFPRSPLMLSMHFAQVDQTPVLIFWLQAQTAEFAYGTWPILNIHKWLWEQPPMFCEILFYNTSMNCIFSLCLNTIILKCHDNNIYLLFL